MVIRFARVAVLAGSVLAASVLAVTIGGCNIEPNPSPWGGNPAANQGMDAAGGGTTEAGTAEGGDTEGSTGVYAPGADAMGHEDTASWTGEGGTDDTTGEDTTTGGWDAGAGTTGGGTTGVGTGGVVGGNGECLPNCEAKQCGPDGCGGSCGWCSGTDSCQAGACVQVEGCTPDCADKMIGQDDLCGGVCSGSGVGIGLVPGGAQDAAYFTSQLGEDIIPAPETFPIEGWLTEHGTALPAPKSDRLVTVHAFAGLFYDPIEGAPTVAMQLGMNSGLSADEIEAGQFNLTVVIDVSGSMDDAGKMDFVKLGLVKMLDSLDDGDLLSVVTYSNAGKVVLQPTSVTAETKEDVINLVEGLSPAGGTNIYQGLKLGYETCLKNIAKAEYTPRVIMLSDGVPTKGITDTPSILSMSGSFNTEGLGLTTIGVGQDFNFELMHGLASQGNGNFYFLDAAEKLTQVFEEEIKYLLTPVADNLEVWFTLPNGYGVEDVYGFEFKHQEDGTVRLLGPSPQYSINGTGGGPGTGPSQPTGEAPQVAVSTLFASKKNGLLMIKISSPAWDMVTALEGTELSTVHYSYDMVDAGAVEAFSEPVKIGSLEYDTEGGFQFFSGATMQRNFCVLRSGLAMKDAAQMWADAATIASAQAGITTLNHAITFCEGINVQNNEPRIADDVTLMRHFQDLLCAAAQCEDPAAQ